MEYTEYSKKGFIPRRGEREKKFLTRADIMTEKAAKLREMVQEKSPSLKKYFYGDLESLKLNPRHKSACAIFSRGINMRPDSFVGLQYDMEEVIPKIRFRRRIPKDDSPQGLTEKLSFEGTKLPLYSLWPGNPNNLQVSVHELYHCTRRFSRGWIGLREALTLKGRNEILFEAFRADQFHAGYDLNLERNQELIRTFPEWLKKIIIKSPLPINETDIPKFLDPVLIRKGYFLKSEDLQEDTKQRNKLAYIFAVIAPLVVPSAFFFSMPLFLGAILPGSYLFCKSLSLAYQANTGNGLHKKIVKFMAEDREPLKEEFGKRGADFLVYTLNYPEMRAISRMIKKKSKVRDYLGKKKDLRSKVLLEHAESLV